jgi:hypothetical protein
VETGHGTRYLAPPPKVTSPTNASRQFEPHSFVCARAGVAVSDVPSTHAFLYFPSRILAPISSPCIVATPFIRFLNCILTVCRRLLQEVAINTEACISFLPCFTSLVCSRRAPLFRLIQEHSTRLLSLHNVAAFPHAPPPVSLYSFGFFLAPFAMLCGDTRLTKQPGFGTLRSILRFVHFTSSPLVDKLQDIHSRIAIRPVHYFILFAC